MAIKFEKREARISRGKLHPVGIRMPLELHQKVNATASALGWTQSEFIIGALRNAIEEVERQNGKAK